MASLLGGCTQAGPGGTRGAVLLRQYRRESTDAQRVAQAAARVACSLQRACGWPAGGLAGRLQAYATCLSSAQDHNSVGDSGFENRKPCSSSQPMLRKICASCSLSPPSATTRSPSS